MLGLENSSNRHIRVLSRASGLATHMGRPIETSAMTIERALIYLFLQSQPA